MAQKRTPRKTAARRLRRPWKRLIIGLLILGLLTGVYVLFLPNTGSFTRDEYLYIRTGSDYDDVKKVLLEGGFVRDMASFDLLARRAGYPEHIHPGKYHIPKGMNNLSMVRLLRSGRQTPVRLVINKLRTQDDFVRLVATQLEADSQVLRQMFRDTTYLAQFGLDTATVMAAVLPDTYEFYWNTTADKAFRKIARNVKTFWTPARRQKANRQGLTYEQVSILASIVEEETNNNTEKPLVASVYLNRLHKGIRLQADPTARFAWGDFTIKRITSVHTALASPYNTYYTAGLPPGPICTPSKASLDAVLNAPKTNYLYFCAKEDFSGTHRFAATYQEHLSNARLYQQALNARGIH